MATPLWAIGLMIASQVIGAFAALGLKLGSGRFSLNPFRLLRNYYLIGGLAGYVGATVLGLAALRAGELSVIYPMVATVYIFVAFLSKWFLRERMNAAKWLGIACIIAGVAAIGLGSA
jgi:uncharacterized membrane protein